MRILLIKDAFDLAYFLRHLLDQRDEAVELEVIDFEQLKAKSELLPAKPDIIVAALFPMPWHDAAQLERYGTCLQMAKQWAEQQAIPLIAFSSNAVFDGLRIAYQESDVPNPVDAYGFWCAEQEAVLTAYSRSIIIRTSWLYGVKGDNFLTASIKQTCKQQMIMLNSAAKACPTSVDDLARVVLAIVLQIEWGADNWGIFHYVASDTALGFQFLEAILSQATRYKQTIDAKQVAFEHQESVQNHFYFNASMLKCNRLLDNFGIHQRPWRSLMPKAVKGYFEAED